MYVYMLPYSIDEKHEISILLDMLSSFNKDTIIIFYNHANGINTSDINYLTQATLITTTSTRPSGTIL